MATSADPLLQSAAAGTRGVDALCMFAADGACDFKPRTFARRAIGPKDVRHASATAVTDRYAPFVFERCSRQQAEFMMTQLR
jgi:hypothetical protein